MVRPIAELIEESCQAIYPILLENNIPETPAAMKLSILAYKGKPEVCLDRMGELLAYLDKHNDKITNDEFRALTIELMEQYPE